MKQPTTLNHIDHPHHTKSPTLTRVKLDQCPGRFSISIDEDMSFSKTFGIPACTPLVTSGFPQKDKKKISATQKIETDKTQKLKVTKHHHAWFPGLTRERFLRHSLENRCHELGFFANLRVGRDIRSRRCIRVAAAPAAVALGISRGCVDPSASNYSKKTSNAKRQQLNIQQS